MNGGAYVASPFLLEGREGYKEREGTLRDRRDRRDREDKMEATISVVRVIPFVFFVTFLSLSEFPFCSRIPLSEIKQLGLLSVCRTALILEYVSLT